MFIVCSTKSEVPNLYELEAKLDRTNVGVGRPWPEGLCHMIYEFFLIPGLTTVPSNMYTREYST